MEKTSADWDNLPIRDVKLMCAYISVKHRREINIISAGVGGFVWQEKKVTEVVA